jgi:hypothetical protein
MCVVMFPRLLFFSDIHERSQPLRDDIDLYFESFLLFSAFSFFVFHSIDIHLLIKKINHG